MRGIRKAAGITVLVLGLAGCGGSGSGSLGNPAPTDLACSGSGCERSNDQPAAALVCGGVTGASCPQGYRCVDDPADACTADSGADCAGICVLGEPLAACGGLTGAACDPGYVCADDPDDTCEGGPAVDCPGICRPAADGECSTDADCPVLRVACSVCADGSVSCPSSGCEAGKCAVSFKPCSEAQVCGGISGLACEPGFECVDDPTDECAPENGGADCRGICQPEKRPPTCGGITGEACPPDLECVDDESDTCDPRAGGADCPGLCVPPAPQECESDADCPLLRVKCSVCADGSESCPRSQCVNGGCTVVMPACSTPSGCGGDADCKPGDYCADDPDDACDPATGLNCPTRCIRPETPRPCGGQAGDTCPPGYECFGANGDSCSPDAAGIGCAGVCQPIKQPECRSDDECPHVLAPCVLCPDGSDACPGAQCVNGVCSVTYAACGPEFCGGIAGFPCAPGSTCVDNPNDNCDPTTGGADCGGICVREEEPQSCGGFAGKPCPEGYECAEDPRDECDPATGGADCPGVCRPAPMRSCNTDSDCPQIGAPCQICADGTVACPRSFCANGQCSAEFETCRAES